MNTEPLRSYIKSIQAHKEGRKGDAEGLLCDSLGIKEPTSYMKSTLPKLVDGDNPNDAVLAIIIDRTKRQT